jgi:hypothetical protein
VNTEKISSWEAIAMTTDGHVLLKREKVELGPERYSSPTLSPGIKSPAFTDTA